MVAAAGTCLRLDGEGMPPARGQAPPLNERRMSRRAQFCGESPVCLRGDFALE